VSDVSIAAKDRGTFGGYLARPSAGKGSGILVIQEIFGVNQVMRDICDDWARAGYFALCPDLFWRQQPGIQLTDQTDAEWQKAFQLYKGFDEAKGVEDLIQSLAYFRKLAGVSGRIGTVGYCLGGKLAFLMATRSDADCNVGFYGVGIEAALGEASRITKPLLLHVAEKDQFCPPEAQAKIKQGLMLSKATKIHSYPGCDHAFARVGGAHYDPDAANLANGRTEAFFKSYL
jgi:carboxymethylenebutenolidase